MGHEDAYLGKAAVPLDDLMCGEGILEKLANTNCPIHDLLRRRWSPRAFADRPVEPEKLRSEEHTSELQSQSNLVCRLLLEKKKITICEMSVVMPGSCRQHLPVV